MLEPHQPKPLRPLCAKEADLPYITNTSEMECTLTSSTSSGSSYSSLNVDVEEIRLATLSPGSYDDALVIGLSTVTISGAVIPEYEALSYTWGKDVGPEKAILNGKPVSITANLDCALRHLRHEDRTRVLWVDALCINQNNVHERNHQVQLMRQIYSRAHTVIIWLGPAEEGDDWAIRNVHIHATDWEDPAWDQQAFDALARICNRPWFRRVWIVQELKLARSDPTIYLGRNIMSWQVFYDFIRIVHNTKATWPKQLQRSSLKFDFSNAASHITRLGQLREAEVVSGLVDILVWTDECGATDPRDKVYGMLSLINKPRSYSIVPDYTKSPQEVFVETVVLLIRDDPVGLYGQLPLHSMRNIGDIESVGVPGLPSWCIDFTIDSRIMATHLSYYNRPMRLLPKDVWRWTFEIRVKRLATLARMSPDNMLHTVGAYIGSIEDAAHVVAEETRRHSIFSPEPRGHCLSDNTLQRIYNDMLTWSNIPTGTLLHSLHHGTQKTTPEEIYLPRTFELSSTKYKTAAPENPPSPPEMWRRIVRSAHGMVLFTTDGGRNGMSYHPDTFRGILPGDVVVGLFGVNLPFILRPLDKEGKTYRMVNVAYLSGHECFHVSLRNAAKGTTEDDVWNNLEGFGLREYVIV